MSPSFSPTPAELAVVNQIFQQADPQKLGVVTGDAAVKVFDGAKLPPAVLGEIWEMSDEDNNGWLSKKGVAMAVRLMGWAQQGRKMSPQLLEKPGPLPKLDGITPIQQQNTGMSIPSSPLPLFPTLTPQDRDKFTNIFRKAGPVNGLLSGERSRDIFLKSKLPNDQLLQIWNLADTQDRGALDAADFVIGMFFINGLMSGTIKFIPTSLPPGLYQQAGGAVASHLSGSSGTFSPVHSTFSIQPQATGQRQLQPNHTGMSSSSIPSRIAPALPARPSAVNTSFAAPAQPAAPAWDVTPAEKATFDGWFDGLDTQRVGYINGDVAVPFMLQSNLPGEILASIWDLSDLNSDGKLTKEGFSVAMHLIQKKIAGGEVPSQLPPSLIPPSMRSRLAVQQKPPPPQEPVRDLFSFDDSPPPSAVAPQQTGGFATMQAQPTGGHSSIAAQRTGARSPQPDPFVSAMSPNMTGTPRNFLDDDEPAAVAASPPLQDKSAEIGNTKNQLNSTTRSMDAAKAERAALEETLANQAAQLSSLQTQLSLAKASYESEVQLLAKLKERHATQQGEIQATREELIRAESDLSALKVEKAEVEGAFMRDKEDARELHRRMVETGQQSEAIKVEVEKLKKDAKQQKGLLAIAKKQLSSKEADKAKAEKEREEASAEVGAIAQEQGEVDAALAALDASPVAPVPRSAPVSPAPAPVETVGSPDSVTFAAAQPLPVSPEVTAASPPVSVKSNNPFDRLMASGSTTPRSQSPFAAFSPTLPTSGTSDNISDDIFSVQSHDDDKPESLEGLAYDSPAPKKPAALDNVDGGMLGAPVGLASPPMSANDTEFFHTPPSSAQLSPTLEAEKYPSIDEFTSVFAPAEQTLTTAESKDDGEKAKAASEDKKADFDSAFDLDGQAKEIDVPESDSDSSDDEDEIPLSQIKSTVVAAQDKAQAPVKEPSNDVGFDDVFGEAHVPEPTGGEGEVKKAEPKPEVTFDDIFGAPAPTETNGKPAGLEVANNGVGASSPSPPVVAGVDAFDEALGKISPTGSSQVAPTQAFSFDAAFDDNFDFAAAKTADFAPAPVEQTAPQLPAAPAPAVNFDDIFTASGLNGNGSAVSENAARRMDAETKASEPTNASSEPAAAISFDDAFSGDLASSLGVSSAPEKVSKPTPAPAPASNGPSSSTNPFPSVNSPPKATAASPRPSTGSAGASSPVQERIAPARTASPKPRLSSSSSKEGHIEKPKETATRHSKISFPQLRLPFGRKKKQQQQQHEPMPNASTHLSPHAEQIERIPTPAMDDDVEAVKQLTNMGFPRSVAVNALEKNGYDVQRALISLLPPA